MSAACGIRFMTRYSSATSPAPGRFAISLRDFSARGRRNEKTVIMIGADLDSVRAGPGINDNGLGSATLLELVTYPLDRWASLSTSFTMEDLTQDSAPPSARKINAKSSR
ncbi:hypothetical protein DFH09DRAFT_1315824 [Mycena vulgaris]|nr:hypothetical protein DFH09DRAFT_1315824 [Mycena vulgaris]